MTDDGLPEEAPLKPSVDAAQVRETVARIIVDVRTRGLDAVRQYSRTFDGWVQLQELPTRDVTEKSWAAFGEIVVVSSVRLLARRMVTLVS